MGARDEHGGDGPHERAHLGDGRSSSADSESSESAWYATSNGMMSRHQVADLCGVWQTLCEPSEIFDPMSEVDHRESILLTREDNWVAKEMWNYFSKVGLLQDP